MNGLSRTLAKLRSLLTNARVEEELQREIAAHLALLEDDLRRKGMTADEAHQAARRAYGGVEQAKQLHRDERSLLWLHQSARSIRFGMRMLLKNPGQSLAILLTLALGIGANTAIFTVNYAAFLAPLPYPQADQLVMVWSKIQGFRNEVSVGDFTDWKNQRTAFQDLNGFTGGSFNLATQDQPENVQGTLSTPGFYRMEGNEFFLGRDFLPEEGQVGANRVVILTHKLWERLGANSKILGTQLQLDGQPYTIVGVFAPGWADRGDGQLTVPLVFTPDQMNHDRHWLLVMGRLRPGVTIKQAQADMDAVTRHIAQVNPGSNKGWGSLVEAERNVFVSSDTKLTLRLLLGASGFVLLIACVNIANLLLAKSLKRQKEMAVRSALGASAATIFAQLITESLMLAIGGGILGVGVGYAGLRGLLAAMPKGTLSLEADVQLNLPILLFSLAATTLAGLLFGCAPAWYASQTDPAEVLKDGGSAGSGTVRHWLRRSLVVAEFALALTLLAGAGLAIQSFVNLLRVDLGIKTDHILTFFLPVPESRPKNPEQIVSYYRRLLDNIRSVPGVSSATAMTGMPLRGAGFGMPFTIVGKPDSDEPSLRAGTRFGMVTPDYFPVFGIRVVLGRTFDSQDTSTSVKVAMVSASFADKYLNGTDPLRQRVSMPQLIPGAGRPGPAVEWQIVGVYYDVRNPSSPTDTPEMLVPFWQTPWPNAEIAVRTVGDPSDMTNSIAAAVHAVDPQIPLANPRTMEQVHDELLSSERFTMILFTCFGAVALLLAALGIYSVMSFSVAARTHEIALRMALGAGRERVVVQIVREGLALACIGLAIGLVGAFFVRSAMRSMLFGVGTLDFTALGAVGVILLGASLLACYLPARRAASVEPMQVLRTD